MKAKRSIYNLIAAVFSQFIIVALGFVIPKLTINNYGSETNGFMSTVTQIYGYIGLLEAGLTTATIQALYKPLAQKNKEGVSSVISASKVYYFKVSVYYAIAVLVVGIMVPVLIDSSLKGFEMIAYFILFGLSNIINFCFTAHLRPLLIAEGKNYVNSVITTFFHLFSQGIKIALLFFGLNIVVLQATYTCINILQILVYYIYFKKRYKWIDKKAEPNFDSLKQRNAFFVLQVSNLIFSCIDIVLLSVFCNLKVSSVYAVYILVFNAISTVLSLFVTSTQFVLGQTYNEDKDKYLFVHGAYENILVTIAFVLYVTAMILTAPFIKLYTKGVTDINYVDYVIPIMFAVNGILATCKSTSLNLVNISYNAKNTLVQTLSEAGINLVISVILVKRFGIRGVLLGTGIALACRLIEITFYANKKILKASTKESFKLYALNFLTFIIICITYQKNLIIANSYLELICKAVVVFFVILIVFTTLNILTNIKMYKEVFCFAKQNFTSFRRKHP